MIFFWVNIDAAGSLSATFDAADQQHVLTIVLTSWKVHQRSSDLSDRFNQNSKVKGGMSSSRALYYGVSQGECRWTFYYVITTLHTAAS